jgi:hypothetical protein
MAKNRLKKAAMKIGAAMGKADRTAHKVARAGVMAKGRAEEAVDEDYETAEESTELTPHGLKQERSVPVFPGVQRRVVKRPAASRRRSMNCVRGRRFGILIGAARRRMAASAGVHPQDRRPAVPLSSSSGTSVTELVILIRASVHALPSSSGTRVGFDSFTSAIPSHDPP